MAIYHFNAQVISRSSGRSSTAAAAYRAGEKIKDERTGEIHDYTRKKGVDSSWILAPDSAPDWVFNREKLWNTVESVERRRDSQLAREINVALPTELDNTQQLELVKEFVNEQFVSEGMVADIAFHDLASHNPHAHFMLTMREIDEDGFSAKKNRNWNKKDWLEKQREAWANHTNKALEIAGVDQTIDHRSLEVQGIKRIPQIHLGVAVNAMRQRGIATEREEQYLEIEAANKEIRTCEFHLELVNRLESSYKNNPELETKVESTTINQEPAIQPLPTEQINELPNLRNDYPETVQEQIAEENIEPRDQLKEAEHKKELERLEKVNRANERLADLRRQLNEFESDTIADKVERNIKAREQHLKEQTIELEPAMEFSEPNPEPESHLDAEKILDLTHGTQRSQVLKITWEITRQRNSGFWNGSPDTYNYNLTNRDGLLKIEAKDGRGEILKLQDGKFTTQRFTEKDLKVFQGVYASSFQDQIAHTAERFLHLTGREIWNSDQGSLNYNLSNRKGLLVIEAKDGRGEILRCQNGKITTKELTLEDVEKFEEINTGLDEKLEQVKSQQRNRSDGFER